MLERNNWICDNFVNGQPRLCDDEYDCEAEECCVTNQIFIGRGFCQSNAQDSEFCSILEQRSSGKYTVYCPCRRGFDCVPEVVEDSPFYGIIKYNQRCLPRIYDREDMQSEASSTKLNPRTTSEKTKPSSGSYTTPTQRTSAERTEEHLWRRTWRRTWRITRTIPITKSTTPMLTTTTTTSKPKTTIETTFTNSSPTEPVSVNSEPTGDNAAQTTDNTTQTTEKTTQTTESTTSESQTETGIQTNESSNTNE